MPEASEARLRAFWSGTLTFGLVSIPVDLFAANRGRGGGLRMVTADGTPLRRRYVCPADEEPVSYDELIRGYEVEKGRFVTVTSDELESLAPEQSRDIDLRRFVPRDDIPPMYFQRAYFLMPAGRSTRAYYLLTEVMEKTGRAGVATFVMRGKAYVIAILAENGVLRAETLRFPDELRTPADVGLPEEWPEVDKKQVTALGKAIDRHTEKDFDPDELRDGWVERLEALVADKLERGEDIYETPESAEAAEATGESDEGGEVVDLMAVLKQRLGASTARTKGKGKSKSKPKPKSRSSGDGAALKDKTKSELYEQAQELDIPGRSSMTKDELIRALRAAS